MKIGREVAQHAIAGTVPPDTDAYYQVANFVSNEEPYTIGRAGAFVALGKRLKARGGTLQDEVDISEYEGKIDAEEAFDALNLQFKKGVEK